MDETRDSKSKKNTVTLMALFVYVLKQMKYKYIEYPTTNVKLDVLD